MDDRDISLTAVLATIGWAVGVLLTLFDLVIGPDTGALGVVCAAAAATLNVRHFFCKLAAREIGAFELGREYEERLHSVP